MNGWIYARIAPPETDVIVEQFPNKKTDNNNKALLQYYNGLDKGRLNEASWQENSQLLPSSQPHHIIQRLAGSEEMEMETKTVLSDDLNEISW